MTFNTVKVPYIRETHNILTTLSVINKHKLGIKDKHVYLKQKLWI